MGSGDTGRIVPDGRWRLPRRDLLLIPGLAVLTLVLLAGLMELVARGLFRQSQTSTMACLVVNDPATGVRGIPGTRCRQKAFESALIDYRFNDCASAPAGTYRIVLIGSSVAYGMHVQQPDSFAARLAPLLARRTGYPVDVYDEAMQWGLPASMPLRGSAILAPRPDMILYTLTPFDIANARLLLPFVGGVQEAVNLPGLAHPQAPAAAGTTGRRTLLALPGRAWARLIGMLGDTRSVFMLQHFLFLSQSQYLGHTLTQGSAVDYLRVPPSAALADGLAVFRDALTRVAARAYAAGVPLVVTLLPSRPQAIMLSNGAWQPGYDPDQLARLVRPIVEAAGGRYVDMTRGLRDRPDAGGLFFSVDEHLPPAGHAMFAALLADALMRDHAVPRHARSVR